MGETYHLGLRRPTLKCNLFGHFNPGLLNLKLLNHELFNPIRVLVKNSVVEKSVVEVKVKKSRVGMSCNHMDELFHGYARA